MELDFGDQLPCGGYAEEDKKIKHNMKILSDQTADQNSEQNSNTPTNQNSCDKDACCVTKKGECCNQLPVKEEQAKRLVTGAKCKKCKAEPAALIHKNDPICKDCLLKNIEYKCRLTLENHMKVRAESSILLCFSGGINSICLAYILSNLQKRYQKHHLFGKLRCIHIQQQDSLPEGYKELFEKELGLELEIISIARVFEGESHHGIEDVRKVFAMFSRSANTSDLLTLLRDHLIFDYARKNKFDFVVKGLNCESIAGSIFKYFAKGVGGDVTELSSKEGDSLFYYPLRQHVQKELQYFFHSNKCGKVSMVAEDDDLSNSATGDLDEHLSSFILNLQTMYSHTAPAITRTSEKIESRRGNEQRCQWCMFKGSFAPFRLCRKCERMYQSRNNNFDQTQIPEWMAIQEHPKQ